MSYASITRAQLIMYSHSSTIAISTRAPNGIRNMCVQVQLSTQLDGKWLESHSCSLGISSN